MVEQRLKAIETRYKGFRFRSRLEARWAVFFDAMGIPWEYEREGYDLGQNGLYLPDFWLPKWRVHLEVKGAWATEDEKQKCRALRDASERAVMLVSGPINNFDSLIFCWDSTDSSGGSSEWMFRFGHTTHPFYFVSDDSGRERDVYADSVMQEKITHGHICEIDSHGEAVHYNIWDGRDRVLYFVETACSARFEHGEHGQ